MPGDARALAASIVRQVDTAPWRAPFLCYGTVDTSVAAWGRRASFSLDSRSANLDETWAAVDAFLRANAGEYIAGFIGFDPANALQRESSAPRQKIDLFVPANVIECTASGYVATRGGVAPQLAPADAPPARAAALDPARFDRQQGQRAYARAVASIIRSIQQGTLERLTLARRIDIDRALDLAATFLADGSRHACARNFYFGNECIRFAGQSPELLAEGNTRCFHTHKLSGTYRRVDDLPLAELTRRFQADARIRAEHHSSTAAIETSLQMLGEVDVTRFQVMELPGLLHGWSQFITRPRQPGTTAGCLRAVFPYGMQPLQAGFEALREYERFPRGPYYGLVGVIRPDGDFSFTQVLRAAFAGPASNYLIAGAAITRQSTPELEVAETCTKLAAIRVFEQPLTGR